jgi:cation transport regulator ChaB
MPYTMKNMPEAIKGLPEAAQKMWVAACNAALEQSPGDETKAFTAGWSAVKTKFQKGANDAWVAKADVSFDQVRDLIRTALYAKHPDSDIYLQEVYPAYVIYELASQYFKLPYSILEGNVQFGDNPIEVQNEWVEAKSQGAEDDEFFNTAMRLDLAKDPEGSSWDVTICKPGFTKNGWFIPDETLAQGAALFENVDVNLFELPQGATHLPDPLFDLKSLLVKNKVGWIDQVKHQAGEGLKGVLHFLDSAQWLGRNIMQAMKDGVAVYGLSYDCPVRAKKDMVDNKPVLKIIKFLSADSVDIVSRPAAGGQFNRAVASVPVQEKEKVMDKKQLWEMILKARPALLTGKELDKVTDEEMVSLARMAMDPEKKQPDDNLVTKEDLEKMRCGMDLKDKLSGSDLPEPAKERIRKTFEGRVFAPADLEGAIAGEKDYLAKMAVKPEDELVPARTIVVGIGTLEKAQMAMDRTFGLTKETMLSLARMERLDHRPFFGDVRSTQDYADFDQIPAFSGLRDMYEFFTGDPEVNGRFNRKRLPADLRASADINSATFSFVLGNTLGRRLVNQYRETDYGEDLLISVRKPVKDFRTQEAVLIGGFGDLDPVDPELADYVEIAPITDEESTYAILQWGNILTITRKIVINDDISTLLRAVNSLGRAARRTHANYVWKFFINNANCSDGTAWFTGAGLHVNLGAAALTQATALIAYQALAKMTEKDSGERLGMLDAPDVKPTLIYPVDLLATAEGIVNDDFYFSANDLTTKLRNSLKGKILGRMISRFTDANDWGLIMPNNVIDIVEMGYLNGRQEPEMFLADAPQAEQVFVADKIRHKVRLECAGAVIDYRGGYKAVV